MKFPVFALLILLTSKLSGTDVKRKDPFQQKIDSINYFLTIYDTLSPFSEYEGNRDLIDGIQAEIVSRLLVVLNDNKILKYDLSKTFDPNGLYWSGSIDGRVQFLTIDAKNGGSWRMQITIMHTRLKDGTVQAITLGDNYAAASFGDVHLVDSIAGVYIAIGWVQTCNTCSSNMVIEIVPDSMVNPEIVYSFDTRIFDDNDLSYSDSTKTISGTHSIRTDDMLSGSPDDYFTSDDDDSEGPPMKITFHTEYKFVRGKFVRVNACWSSEEIQ